MRDELSRTVAAMKRARDLFRGGKIMEGYEVSVDGIRLYAGRYFGQADLNEQGAHKGAAVFSPSSPVLPYIVTFQVGKISAEKRPMLSVICALSLENLLHKPNSDVAKEISRLEIELAKEDVHLDVYRFTELDYAVLSLPVD
ncbi:MAG TPA: hypothetical protein VLB04_01040 [Methanotrichaceae archaeon]|nr:hypothetical protein [Methanotrichaceae archaeon]